MFRYIWNIKINLAEILCNKEIITAVHFLRSKKVMDTGIQKELEENSDTSYYSLQEVNECAGPRNFRVFK